MTRFSLRRAALLLLMTVFASTSQAEPYHYQLDPDHTKLSFIWSLGAGPIIGSLPPKSGDIVLDFANDRNSSVNLQLDVASIRAGLPFATQALKSRKILNAEKYPTAVYQSKSVSQSGTEVDINGQLSIRGVTRPVEMQAQLFRQEGTDPSDLNNIAIRMEGTLNRNDIGATAWPDDVASDVTFLLEAYLTRVN